MARYFGTLLITRDAAIRVHLRGLGRLHRRRLFFFFPRPWTNPPGCSPASFRLVAVVLPAVPDLSPNSRG